MLDSRAAGQVRPVVAVAHLEEAGEMILPGEVLPVEVVLALVPNRNRYVHFIRVTGAAATLMIFRLFRSVSDNRPQRVIPVRCNASDDRIRKNRIIEPLHSRCSVYEFQIQPKERPKIAMAFFKRLQTVLKAENVEFEPASL